MFPDGSVIFVNPKLREQWDMCFQYAKQRDIKPTRFQINTVSRRNIEDGEETTYYVINDTYTNCKSIEYETNSVTIAQLNEYITTLELMFHFCNIHKPN